MSKRVTPIHPPPPDSRPKNKLLASLPRPDFDRIRPLDRQGLEAASCECYSTVKEHFDRLGL